MADRPEYICILHLSGSVRALLDHLTKQASSHL